MSSPKIVELEFFTTYPQREGNNKVLIAIVVLDNNKRALIYAPNVEHRSMSFNSSNYEEYHWRNIPIDYIPFSRHLTFINELYSIPKADIFFQVIMLDDINKKKIKKEDIEKLFDCIIDG